MTQATHVSVTVDGQTGQIAKALTAAILETEALGKESFNNWHKYAYTSMESILDAGRKAMAKHGLSARRCGYRVDWERAENNEPIAGILHNRFVLEHSSGEIKITEAEWPFYTEKGRTIEKALAGALTTSLGYWIRDLLLLPRQDAPEPKMDEQDDRDYTPPPRKHAERPKAESEAPKPAPETIPEGWPSPESGRLGGKFAEFAERRMELAGLTLDKIREGCVARGVAKEFVTGPMSAWEPSVAVLVSKGIEAKYRQVAASRPQVPTQEAAETINYTRGADVPAEAQGGNGTTGSAAAPKVEGPAASSRIPRDWRPPAKLTSAHPAYWQNTAMGHINRIAPLVRSERQPVNVLIDLEDAYGITPIELGTDAITRYKRLCASLSLLKPEELGKVDAPILKAFGLTAPTQEIVHAD